MKLIAIQRKSMIGALAACVATWLTGCAQPIQTEYYSRTPATEAAWCPDKPASSLRVGIGAESIDEGRAFVDYALRQDAFGYVGLARANVLNDLDCQIECGVAFEHSGGEQVHYCLGRLVANVYNADHSVFLDRIVRFHEAMYTTNGKQVNQTSDGQSVYNALRHQLYDELIADIGSDARSEPKAETASSPE